MYCKNNDIHGVFNGKRLRFTLRNLFDICGIRIPEQRESAGQSTVDFDRYIDRLYSTTQAASLRNDYQGNECHVVISGNRHDVENPKVISKILAANNPVITHMEEEGFDRYPNYFKVDSSQDAMVRLGQYIMSIFDLPRVCITGSVGKSTTSLLTQHIFSDQGKVFCTFGNLNTYELIISELFKRMDHTYRYLVQETGGAIPHLVERSAMVLQPNFFCITNIFPQHLSDYKTMEGILEDKSSLDRYAADGAVGIINGDDDLLLNHNYRSKIVTCGIKNTDCDYVATDIEQVENEYLQLNIHNRGRIYPVKVKLLGEYNAYNIMFAFAIANEAGISPDHIISSLRAFRITDRMRQFSQEVAGRKLIVDCFNISINGLIDGTKILDMWKNAEGKKIAFLGGKSKLGENAHSVNYRIGKDISQYRNITDFVIYGHKPGTPSDIVDKIGDSYSLYEGLVDNTSNQRIRYEHSFRAAINFLSEQTEPGDVILFKGTGSYPMWPIIDEAFGTNYYFETGLGRTKPSAYGNFTYRRVITTNSAVIVNTVEETETIVIPDIINCIPLHALAFMAFSGKTIKSLDLGNSVRHIGNRCFERVRNLESVVLPASCLYIGRMAFGRIQSLKTVHINGARTIESAAFKGCSNLEKVVFAKDCETISEDAFDECGKVTIFGPAGSNVERYAKTHGIPFTVCSVCAITGHPIAAAAGVGESVTYSITTSGDVLSYQWQYKTANGSEWINSVAKGTDTASITVNVKSVFNGRHYRCLVTDADGNTIVSTSARLTVQK